MKPKLSLQKAEYANKISRVRYHFFFLTVYFLADMSFLKDEELLEYYFSLPDEENNSEADCDEDAAEELSQLHETSCSNHNSDNPYEEHETMEYTEHENGSYTYNQDTDNHDWGSNVLYFEKIKRNPSLNAKVTDDLVPGDSELDYFLTILSEETLKLIRDNTNLYATQERNRRHGVARSVTNNWTPTTVEEIKTYIAIHILMGIHSLPELQNYWSSDPILGIPAIADMMTKNRFKKLTENLHCNDNEKAVPKGQIGYDRLHKLRPLIDALNLRLPEVYTPSDTLAVDESMVPFKGRSSLKQYMPMKPVKRGYKVWCLADSTTGYICRFDIYTGKRDFQQNTSFSLGENVVLDLCSIYENNKKLIVFDNFFTSLVLLKTLHERGLFAVGTVRPNRKGLPDMLKKKIIWIAENLCFSLKAVWLL